MEKYIKRWRIQSENKNNDSERSAEDLAPDKNNHLDVQNNNATSTSIVSDSKIGESVTDANEGLPHENVEQLNEKSTVKPQRQSK